MKKKTNLEIEKEIISNGIKDISDVLARVSLGDFSVFCKPVEDPSLNIVVSGFNAIISNLKEKDKEFRSCKNSEKRGAELKELKNKTKELEGLRVALKNQAQPKEYNIGECKNELEYLKRRIRKIERRWLD